MSPPIQVAIVGGGCAGIAAAFELTRPQLQGKYAVTVYQLGWRLGGKGASGRGEADRIEEHGLHLWMGFYENAFRLMRECYAELGRDRATHRIADWQDAFVPDPFCGAMDHTPDGRWLPWTVHFPAAAGLPGDADPGAARWTVTDYLRRSMTLLRTVLEAVRSRSGGEARGGPAGAAPGASGPAAATSGDITATMSRLLRYGQLATLSAVIEALRVLDMAVQSLPLIPSELILNFHALITRAARDQIQIIIGQDDEVRRLWEIADLVLAVIRGIIRFRLTVDPRGFDAIDDYDCREWLRLNGASERSVDSAFLRALYDLAFAYEDGDVTRPRIAAGQALRGAVRAFFTYRGAFFWKMKAGMGDVVFAPFFEVLSRRGVRFEFFHRLHNVGLATPGAEQELPHVETLTFDVQARTTSGGPYQPLVDVRGLPCWPAEPRWEQLQDGPALKRQGRRFESHWDERKVERKVLRVGKDFDLVVLAVGAGALPFVCRELIERDPKWRTMVERVKTVPTQALQLWLREDAARLGWRGDQVNISAFVEPFDTWADMSQLIPEESFDSAVGSIAYFCSVLPDPPAGVDTGAAGYPGQRREEVRANARRFLERDIRHLWPNAVAPDGGFRWELLVAASPERPARPAPSGPGSKRPATSTTDARLDTQFWTANVNPSDRYTLSLPGSLQHRISPLANHCDNLTVAGDWTSCGFNEGCVEAAVMSGRLAAHALSQSPPLEEIVGFDHP